MHRDVVVVCLRLDSRDPWIGVEQMANEFADRFLPPTHSAHPVGETDVEQWRIAGEILEPHDPDGTVPDPHGEKRVLGRDEPRQLFVIHFLPGSGTDSRGRERCFPA